MTARLDLDRPLVRHLLAAGFGLLAFALRWCSLDGQELWLDEALTAHIAWAPDGLDFVHNTPPLYFVLVRAWVGLFGVDAVGLRSFSVVTGALFVWAAPLVAREVFGNRAAIPTALAALLLPIHLYYSQEARAYSLLMLELLVAFWLLWRLRRRFAVATWLGLVLCSAAALYTHYLAAIPLAIAWVVIGLLRREHAAGAGPRGVVSAGIAAVAPVLPWVLWWSRNTAFRPTDMSWLAILWEGLPGASAMAWSLELFGIGGQEGHAPSFLKQWMQLAFPDWLRIATLVALGALVLFALLPRRDGDRRTLRGILQAAVLVAGPLLLLWLLSFVKPVYCPGRYDLIALPGFVLLVGAAIATLLAVKNVASRLLAVVLTGVVAVGWTTKDVLSLTASAGPSWHTQVAEQLAGRAGTDELVILTGDTGLPVLARWYGAGWTWMDGSCRHPAGERAFACRLLPTSLESAPAAVMRFEQAVRDGSLDTDLRQLLADAPSTRGVYLVLSPQLLANEGATGQVGAKLVETVLAAGFRFADADQQLGIGHYVKAP